MARKPRQTPGQAPSEGVLSRFELDPHGLVVLEPAARTADLIADLHAVLDAEGPMVPGRPHPAAGRAADATPHPGSVAGGVADSGGG